MDGESILSQEGTTQGDPLAMYMYALGIMPMKRLADEAGAVQSWFADDSSAAARLRRLRLWWDIMDKRGPAYGCYVNPKKSVLVVKERCYQEATELFRDTGVMITDEGSRYLGAAIGRDSFLQSYIKTKVDEWMGELKKLAVFAQTQPQAAYSAYVTGLRGRWAFLCRTMKVPEPMFQPLEDIVKSEMIPALTCGAPQATPSGGLWLCRVVWVGSV